MSRVREAAARDGRGRSLGRASGARRAAALAGILRERGARRAARHEPRQRPLPDGFHRQQRSRAGRRRAGAGCAAQVPHGLPLPDPVGRAAAGRVRARDRRGRSARGGGSARAPARGGADGLRGGGCHLQAACAPCRAGRGRAGSSCPVADAVERLRAVKDDGEVDRIRAAAELADEALSGVARSRRRRAHRARGGDRSRAADAQAGRGGGQLPVDRRGGRPRRASARRARRARRSRATCSSRSTGVLCSMATARTARARTRRASMSERAGEGDL